MTLLEETYRRVDPDGVVNMAYDDSENHYNNGMKAKDKIGKNPLDA